jgi:hypothetical protein
MRRLPMSLPGLGRYQEHLLWPPNFEAKSKQASFKEKIYECEASALTPEPTALF